jgi:hypothetical protein
VDVRVSHQDYDKRPGSGSGGSLGHLCDALEKHLVFICGGGRVEDGLVSGRELAGARGNVQDE